MNRNDVINHVLGNMYTGKEESGGYSYSRPHSQSGGFSVPTASSVGGVGAQSYGGGAGGGGFFPFLPLGGSDEFPDIPEDNYNYSAEYAENENSTSLSDAVSQIKDAFAEQAGKNKTSETEIKAPKTLETQIEKPWIKSEEKQTEIKAPRTLDTQIEKPWIKSEEKQTEIKAPRTLETQIEKPWIKSEEKQTEITNRDILKDTQKKLESEKANQKKLNLQESRLDELTPQYSGSFNRGKTDVASTGVNFGGDTPLYHGRDIQGVGTSGATFDKPSLLNQAFDYTTKQMKEKAENPLPELASWGLAVPALGAVSAGLGAGAVSAGLSAGANVLKFPTAVATAGKIASDVTSAVAEPTKPKKSGTSAKAVTATTPKASTPAPVKISAPAVASTPKATSTAKPTFTDAISQIKSAFSSAISSATPKASTTTQKLTTQEKRLGKL